MKIQTKGVVDLVSGGLGNPNGIVFSTRGGRQIARTGTRPRVKSSVSEVLSRNVMKTVMATFGDLTDEERATWDELAASRPAETFNGPYNAGAAAAYLMCNTWRYLKTGTIAATAGNLPTMGVVTAAEFGGNPTTADVDIVHDGALTGDYWVVSVGPPFKSAQRRSSKDEYRMIQGPSAFSILGVSPSPSHYDLDVAKLPYQYEFLDYEGLRITALNIFFEPGSVFQKDNRWE